MKYCLLNIAFDNTFHGFQYQPKLRTVQGELLKALSPIGIERVYGSSRTDSHVRASSSIIEVEYDDPLKVCKIVDSLEGIAVLGYFETDKFINIRKSLSKEYIYFCDKSLDRQSLMETITEFLGGKMECFSRDPAKKVVLTGIRFYVGKSFTILLFEGRSFSWNFVRISAETIIKRVEGKIPDEEWSELLSCKRRARFKGSAENLILFKTKAPFEFSQYKSRNINKIRSRIFQDFYWLVGVNAEVKDIVESAGFLGKG